MRGAVASSVLLHAAIIVVGYLGLPQLRQDAPLVEEPITVDLVTVAVSVVLSLPFFAAMVAMWAGAGMPFPPLLQLALATAVQFGTGARFYRPAWAALRDGTGNMDLLVVLGTGAAFGLSLYHLFALPGAHL